MAKLPTLSYNEDDGALGVREIFGLLRRHLAFLLLFVGVCTAAAVAIFLFMGPGYRASASLMFVVDETIAPLEDTPRSELGLYDQEKLRSQAEVIGSLPFAGEVMRRLHLQGDPEFNPTLNKSQSVAARFIQGMQDLFASGPDESLAAAVGSSRPLAARFAPVGAEHVPTAEGVQRAVHAYIKNDTHVMVIEATSRNPRKAAVLANVAADVYLQSVAQAQDRRRNEIARWRHARLQELRAETTATERRIDRYRRDAGIFAGEASNSILAEELSKVTEELADARSERFRAESRLEQLAQVRTSPLGLSGTNTASVSPVIQALREDESKLIAERGRLGSTYGPNHPLLRDVEFQIQGLQVSIADEMERLFQAERDRAAIAVGQEKLLEVERQELEERISRQQLDLIGLAELEGDAAARRAVYESLLRTSILRGAPQNILGGEIELIAPAAPPLNPTTNPILITGLAAAASALAGILLVGAKESFDETFRSADQVARYTGLRTLSLVPRVTPLRFRNNAEEMVVAQPRSSVAEAIRYLYACVAPGAANGPARSVLITSSVPGEGKTMVAISLAREAQLAGKRTLLVDLDLHKRGNQRFARAQDRGYLCAANLLEAVSLRSDFCEPEHNGDAEQPLLAVSCKQVPERLVRFLSDAHLADFFVVARQRFDLIIVDSAPILSVADATFLQQLVDDTVLVVVWGKTLRENVFEALTRLSMSELNVRGIVLNKVHPKKHARYGYRDSGVYTGHHQKYYF